MLAAAPSGIASSTAVTFSNARRAAAGEAPPQLLAAGVALASAVMFLRVAAIIAVLNPGLLVLAGPALGAASVLLELAVAAAGWRALGREHPDVQFSNPFGFWAVVGFAVALAAIIVLGRVIGERFGGTGAIIGAVVVGLADVVFHNGIDNAIDAGAAESKSAALPFWPLSPAIRSARS